MLTQSYSITYNKIWLICNKIDVIFAYSEYWVAKTSSKMKQWINWSKTWHEKDQQSTSEKEQSWTSSKSK